MKILKRIIYFICALLLLLSLVVVVCAFSPSLTDSLARALYGKVSEGGEAVSGEDTSGEAGGAASSAGEKTISGAAGVGMGTAGAEGTEITGGTGDADGGSAGDTLSGEDAFTGTTAPVDTDALIIPEGGTGYTQPSEEAIAAPEKVAGRNGYTQVQESGQEVTKEEGEALSAEPDYGEKGDGLDFDTNLYPYYGMLNTEMQKLYRQIYANALALKRTFQPVESVSSGKIRTVFEAVFNDHPELFWLEPGYYGKYLGSGGCVELTLRYNRTAADLDAAKDKFHRGAEAILNVARLKDGDYEKEKYVHDTLAARTEYRLDAPMNQSAYSALAEGRTVCAGYARAFQYLLQQLEIPCYYCTGYAGQNHAWNIVGLEDGYYNVDVTWDDTDPNTYDYFNRTDEDFASTHARRDLSVYLPPCDGRTYRNLERSFDELYGTAGEDAQSSVGGGAGDTAGEDAADSSLRTLEEAGFRKEDILGSLEDYYQSCYEHLRVVSAGSTVEFENVIPLSLWEDVENAYGNRSYEEGYAQKVMTELGAAYLGFLVEGEALADGSCLLHHTISIQ